MVATERDWSQIDRWRIPEFAALVYPACASVDTVRLICAWLAWASRFDDQFDDPFVSRSPERVRVVLDPFFAYTERVRTDGPELRDGDPFLRALAEQVSWTRRMSRVWRLRFLDDIDDYLASYVQEAATGRTGSSWLRGLS